MSRPDDGADYEQQDAMLREESWLRHEIARVACECTRCGGHPENAGALERTLLAAAGLPIIPQRDDAQPDLFAARAA